MREQTKILSVAVATALALLIFSATVVHALFYAPQPEIAAPALEAKAPALKVPPVEYPDRLDIPVLNIDAAVLQVGIARSGHMAVPPNFTDVGWYKYGSVPGQKGSAVMAGHVDNGLGLDGVFKHLNQLKVDDDIYIITKAGSRLHFVVSDIQSYPYTSVPTETLFNRTDGTRLNLVTCDGGWVQGEKTYDHRLVVYATLAP